MPPPQFRALKGVGVRKATESEKPASETDARASVGAFIGTPGTASARKPVEIKPMFTPRGETVPAPFRVSAPPPAETVAAPPPAPAPLRAPVPPRAPVVRRPALPRAETVPAPPRVPVPALEAVEEVEAVAEEGVAEELPKPSKRIAGPRKIKIPKDLKTIGKLIKTEEKASPYTDIETSTFKDIADENFPEFIYQTFGTKLAVQFAQENPLLKDGDACEALRTMDPTDVKVYAYQAFIRDYLRGESPYRGLLVYHGLGSGKTCAAIAAAEALYSQSNKHIIVMTPLSLRENFLQEVSFCGFRHFRYANHWEMLDAADPLNRLFGNSYLKLSEAYMKTIQNIWVPNFEKPANFDELKSKYKDQIKAQIRHVLETRITFYNYNGITEENLKDILRNKKETFDDAVIVIDEVHNLVRNIQGSLQSYLVQGTKDKDLYEPITPGQPWVSRLSKYKRGYLLYRLLTGVRRSKIIGLSGTPIINYPEEIAILANILHGYIDTVKIDTVFTTKQEKDNIKAALLEHPLVHSVSARLDATKMSFEIEGIPEGYMKIDHDGKQGLEKREEGATDIIELEGKIRELISEKFPALIVEPKSVFTSYPLLPPIGTQFRESFFNKETNRLTNAFILMSRLSGHVSYYKGASKQLLPEIVEDESIVIKMSRYQAQYYIKVRLEEMKQESDSKKKGPEEGADVSAFFEQLEAAISSKKKTVGVSYKMRSRQACNFAFPEDIARPRPVEKDEGDKVELKEDREIEGDADAEISDVSAAERNKLEEALDADEEAADSVIKTGAEGVAVAREEKASRGVKSYEQRIKETINKLRENSARYLRIDGEGEFNLNTYSPKYAAIYNKIMEQPGSALVYSQFLMLEGLQCFTLSLETNGFEPIEVVSKSVDKKIYFSFTEKTIESLKKQVPRFVQFTGAMTKEERQLMINIFNCNYAKLPEEIRGTLQELGYEDGGVGNREGQLCKVICITAAGAEGLSLRNCRQVHIMEPYWNEVRLQQVKGRAVRICSHDYDIRQVRIYTYVMTLPVEFLKKELINDGDRTSDEVIAGVSMKKQLITKPLLQVLKNAAVDCRMNTVQNDNEAQCFSFRKIKDGQLYTPNYLEDIKIVNEEFKNMTDQTPEELGLKVTTVARGADIKIGEIIETRGGIPVYAVEKLVDGATIKGMMIEKDGKKQYKWNKPSVAATPPVRAAEAVPAAAPVRAAEAVPSAAPLPPLPKGFAETDKEFYERQDNILSCGRHALNNLLGAEFFSKGNYKIPYSLENRNTLPIPLNEVCKLLYDSADEANRFPCKESEDYHYSTLIAGLKIAGYSVLQEFGAGDEMVADTPADIGFLVNEGSIGKTGVKWGKHWIAIQKEGDTYLLKDSTATDKTIKRISNIVNFILKNPKYTRYFKIGYSGYIDPLQIYKEEVADKSAEEAVAAIFEVKKQEVSELISKLRLDGKSKQRLAKFVKNAEGIRQLEALEAFISDPGFIEYITANPEKLKLARTADFIKKGGTRKNKRV